MTKGKTLLLLIAILASLLSSRAKNDIGKSLSNDSIAHISSDYPDASIFRIDDSLLCAMFPEVTIKCLTREPKRTIFSHVLQYHCTPNSTLHPDYLILVKQSLYDSLRIDINRYAEDVHAIYGYGIYLETTENESPEDVKSLILSYQNSLCGVLFVGGVADAIYEVSRDFNEDAYRHWPCDLFFMDLDGIWTDSDNNGRYDQHTGDVSPEIFMGRLSGEGMSSLGDEITLLRKQLQKSHNFWWKSSYNTSDTVLNYIDKDWRHEFSPYSISPVFASGNVTDIRYGEDPEFSPDDYIQRLSDTQYGFTQLASHSAPNMHSFTNGYVNLWDIKQNTSSSYAYNLFCCSACNWRMAITQGYLGGAYLFNNGKTIAVVGSTKTGGMKYENNFYSQFPTKNIGGALLEWWNTTYGDYHSLDTISWSYGMTLLGDPTIKFRHHVSDVCTNNLVLTTFPLDNSSNLILYRASESINVSGNYTIPQGVHVVFDAPQVILEENFYCPFGASFEIRSEGCEL